MSGAAIRVIVIEDSAVEREALRQVVDGARGFACVGAFPDAESALAEIPRLDANVVLLDIHLPGMSGIDCIRRLGELGLPLRILMLTALADHDRIFKSLKAGASGYLLKTMAPAKLLECIREVHEGGAPMSAPIARQVVDWFRQSTAPAPASELETLSPREEQILSLLAKGFLYKEIAVELGLGLGSVCTYVRRIYEKLHVRSRTEAVLKTMPRR